MKKQNIRIIAALVSAVLLAGLAFGSAYAMDIDYSGELDPETNKPVSSSASTPSNRVILSSTMYYDYDSHDYVFPVNNSLTEIHANVPDGIVTTNSVSVNSGGDSSVIVFCNGNEVTGATDNLREVGNYVVSTGITPVINTAIVSKEPGVGMIGAGISRAPIELFTQALLCYGKEVAGLDFSDQ